jgi:uncharacterized protein (TIGR03435 family)
MTLIKLRRGRIVAAFAGVACLAVQLAAAETGLRVGGEAPPLKLVFPFTKPADQAVTPSMAPRRARVLEFWATYCVPCVAAIPHLNRLVDQFKNEPIDFIAITAEDESLVQRFLGTHSMGGLIALDEAGQTGKSYELTFLPMTVLIDSKGKLAGVTSPSHIDAGVLKSLIAGQAINLPVPIGLYRPYGVGDESGNPNPLVWAVVRPSLEQGDGDISSGEGKLIIQGARLREVLARAYGLPERRINVPQDLDAQRYDALIERAGATDDALYETLKQLLPIAVNGRIELETRPAPVMILSLPPGKQTRLKESKATESDESGGAGSIRFVARPLRHLALGLQYELGRDVVDETALPGLYDLTLKWDPDKPESIFGAVESQLGLALTPGERPMTFLVVKENSGSTAK